MYAATTPRHQSTGGNVRPHCETALLTIRAPQGTTGGRGVAVFGKTPARGHCDPPNWTSLLVVDPLWSGVSTHHRGARGSLEGFSEPVSSSCASRQNEVDLTCP